MRIQSCVIDSQLTGTPPEVTDAVQTVGSNSTISALTNATDFFLIAVLLLVWNDAPESVIGLVIYTELSVGCQFFDE